MPDVSDAQRRAMFAAKEGNSTLGIPQKVGADFIAADKAAGMPSLPKKKAKSKKLGDQIASP
jgi:hypothetical protein